MALTGFASSGAHLIQFIGIKPDFIWYENTCDTPNTEVEAELANPLNALSSVKNATKCEDPIEGMEITMVPAETEQKAEWYHSKFSRFSKKSYSFYFLGYLTFI